MILPLWLRVTMAATIIAAILGIGWSIHHMIWKSGYNAHKQETDAAEKEAVIRRVAENHDQELAQLAERLAIQKEFDDEIKNLRTRIANSDRLRVNTSCGASGASASKSDSSGNGGDTGTRLVSLGTQQDFNALELRVETVFAGCRKAQKFITDSGLAP